jgi:hypothetical protein
MTSAPALFARAIVLSVELLSNTQMRAAGSARRKSATTSAIAAASLKQGRMTAISGADMEFRKPGSNRLHVR